MRFNAPKFYRCLFPLGTMVAYLFILGLGAYAQPTQHEELKKSYFRLKNIDPNILDLNAWVDVERKYELFLKNGENLDEQFFFEYGSLLSELAKATKKTESLEKSRDLFIELYTLYPESALADDGLLKQAEIASLLDADSETSKELYLELIRRYPKSDSAEIARAKLQALENPELASRPFRSASIAEGLPVVVLDPGHGGEDFGATNEFGLLEKDVVLAIALETERLLQQKSVAKVILTRRSDSFVPLLERVEIANKNNAQLFVSLHNNASPKQNQAGLITYVLDDSSDEASRLLAERENRSAGGEASDLDFIVSDLIQSSKHPRSLLLADTLQRQVIANVKNVWPNAKSWGIKKAPFYVLVGARMPCALIELFFLDHEVEGERLSDPEVRNALAVGLANGIESFLAKSAP